ncbi:MAG: sodium-dependent transporter [Bacillota bacterium]|nr:sodium-dependent transporter [Bacillota bacterium]
MKREKLGSRLGFILLSAGCAIGIGNVWKFPYMVGQNGGGAFVMFYFLFLIIIGVPILTMEFSVGRAGALSPIKIFHKLEKPGHKWHIQGYLCLLGNYLLMMFYTTVAGWMLYYLYASVTGKYQDLNPEQIGQLFGETLASPWIQAGFMMIVVIIGFFVLSKGLQNGLERVTKPMMLLLIILMCVLAVNSCMLDGGKEGLIFYLKPDFEVVKQVGLGNVILGALTQAFFTLSLGIGAMAIFGSYIGKERSLLGESINIACLDTFVAVCSGLIIFPACSAYNVAVDSGPSLLFVTLPNVFNNISGGRFWGSLFFLFMVFAAFSTVLAVFENIVSMTMDQFGWDRKKACIYNCISVILLSLPCALGFNILSGIQPLGAGSGILDLEDFLVSNILLPLGSMVFLLFCVTPIGWGWKNYFEEVNTGKGLKIKAWMKPYFQFILPLVVGIVFIMGLM